jgi:hypothetical protein
LDFFRDGAVRAHLAAVHHEFEAREVLFEQPRSELEISARLEEESCVVSVQPLAKRQGFTGLARLAAGEHIIVCRAERGHLDAVLAEDRLERLHGSLDDKEEAGWEPEYPPA